MVRLNFRYCDCVAYAGIMLPIGKIQNLNSTYSESILGLHPNFECHTYDLPCGTSESHDSQHKVSELFLKIRQKNGHCYKCDRTKIQLSIPMNTTCYFTRSTHPHSFHPVIHESHTVHHPYGEFFPQQGNNLMNGVMER